MRVDEATTGARAMHGERSHPMDPTRFDRLTRRLGGSRSRRSFLGTVAALGAALAAGRAAAPEPAAAMIYNGEGAACNADGDCLDGLVCCGGRFDGTWAGTCTTTGNCGGSCAVTGSACPPGCNWGDGCAACCDGFCTSYGTCAYWYSVYQGGTCSLSDPYQCAPGLTCCPKRSGGQHGTCQDVCGY